MINIVDRMVRAFGQQLAPEKLRILMIDPVFIPFPRTWPIIKLGGENITVVPQARFLGRTDTLDSAIDIELEERLDIMKSSDIPQGQTPVLLSKQHLHKGASRDFRSESRPKDPSRLPNMEHHTSPDRGTRARILQHGTHHTPPTLVPSKPGWLPLLHSPTKQSPHTHFT